MRYLIFAGDWYYPSGGANDLQGSTGMESTAIKLAKGLLAVHEWVQVYDLKKEVIVWDEDRE